MGFLVDTPVHHKDAPTSVRKIINVGDDSATLGDESGCEIAHALTSLLDGQWLLHADDNKVILDIALASSVGPNANIEWMWAVPHGHSVKRLHDLYTQHSESLRGIAVTVSPPKHREVHAKRDFGAAELGVVPRITSLVLRKCDDSSRPPSSDRYGCRRSSSAQRHTRIATLC